MHSCIKKTDTGFIHYNSLYKKESLSWTQTLQNNLKSIKYSFDGNQVLEKRQDNKYNVHEIWKHQ